MITLDKKVWKFLSDLMSKNINKEDVLRVAGQTVEEMEDELTTLGQQAALKVMLAGKQTHL